MSPGIGYNGNQWKLIHIKEPIIIFVTSYYAPFENPTPNNIIISPIIIHYCPQSVHR